MWDFVKYKYTKQFSLQHERIRQQSNLTQRLEQGQRLNYAKNKRVFFFLRLLLVWRIRGCIWGKGVAAIRCLSDAAWVASYCTHQELGFPPLHRDVAFWLPLKQSSSWALLTNTHTHIFTHTCWQKIKNWKKYLHHGTLITMGHSSKLMGTTKIVFKRGCASARWRETFNFKMRYPSQTN